MNIDYTNINILSPDVADKVKEEKIKVTDSLSPVKQAVQKNG